MTNKFDKKFNESMVNEGLTSVIIKMLLPVAAGVLQKVLKHQLKKLATNKIGDEDIKKVVNEFIDEFSIVVKKDPSIKKIG